MTVRVLICDDQVPFRVAARLVVEATDGFEVVAEALTGEEAIDLVATSVPDLVLMDLHLPGIDGLEATRRILASTATTVVVLSTYEPEDLAARVLAAGAVAYVPKDAFSPAALVHAWRTAA